MIVVQRSHLVHHHADVRRPDRAFRVATAAASTAAAELPARRDRLSEPQAEGVRGIVAGPPQGTPGADEGIFIRTRLESEADKSQFE